MSSAIDASLLEGHEPWSEAAYSILDEMASRGNMIAVFRKRELQKLASVLTHLPPPTSRTRQQPEPDLQGSNRVTFNPNKMHAPKQMGLSNMDYGLFDNTLWPDDLNAEQLMLLADSLDLDGVDWMTASLDDSSAQSQVL